MPLNSETCPSGCESFCQMGKQLVYDNQDLLDASGDITSWTSWENLIKGDTIQQANGLSKQTQDSLINYIKSAYSAGEFNGEDGSLQQSISEFSEKKTLNNIEIDSTVEKLPDLVKNNTVESNITIVAPSHYNNFLYALTLQEYDPVTQDLKGNAINNGVSAGPTCSKPAGEIVPVAQSGVLGSPYDSSDESLIKASMYNTLAERAKRLLFHPHQCDNCNIQEGGQFGEVVRELGKAIAAEDPPYSQGDWYNLRASVLGVSGIRFRQDCSGFVSACVAVLMSIQTGRAYSSCDEVSGNFMESGSAIASMGATEYFIPANQEHSCESMIFASSGHVEASDENGMIWSGGGGTDGAHMMSTQGTRTSSSQAAYWQGVASGGGGASTGGFNTGTINSDADFLSLVASVSTHEISGASVSDYKIYISAMANRADYFLRWDHYKFWSTPASSGGYFANTSYGSPLAGYDAAYQAAVDVYANGNRACPEWVNTNDAWSETTLSENYNKTDNIPVGTVYTGVSGKSWVGRAKFYRLIGSEVIGGSF